MNRKTLGALQRLIEYVWEDEEANYDGCREEREDYFKRTGKHLKHIFEDITILANYVERKNSKNSKKVNNGC